ncbi:MAG: SDR family oxidoreductase [Alicyclobacillaceae bacterium]|nr:SDR family oxidoreductase [Alicyclobacillaceae bacterium]
MDLGLEGKTVLVMAASRGLGFAIAQAFAREGARVVICGRREEALSLARDRIVRETHNPDVSHVVADVTRAADIEKLFQTAESQFGGVDVLVNNVGGPPLGAFSEVGDDDWQQAFESVLLSAIRSIRLALPHMRQQQWGRIVNVASSSVRQPVDRLILSNTMRAALAGLAKSLATELGPDNILVNTLGPGRIATERVQEIDRAAADRSGISVDAVRRAVEGQIPLGRYGQPDEFAAMAVFLGSAANGYVTGQTILVDGGMVKCL